MAEKKHCEICNRTFKDENGFLQHKADKHDIKPVNVENKSISVSKSSFKLILVIGAIIVLGIIFFSFRGSSGNYDDFAKCLTQNGVKMYGAYWCPHCADQKELFGSSWKYMDYVECSLPNRAGQTEVCSLARIESYPTMDVAGRRLLGVQSLESLSQLTNCPLNQDQ